MYGVKIMIINEELIDKLQSYGLTLSSAIYAPDDKNRDKKPVATFQGNYWPNGKPKFEWCYDWSREKLLKAKRLGIFHDPSSTYDIDFDDKSFVAHRFHSLLPDTFSIGKKYEGAAILTHKIYAKPKGVKVDKWSYPKKVLNGSGRIIERLNKFTVIADQDRTIIRDVKPVEADPADILKRVKMIAFFTELVKHWPEEGSRDEAYLRLTGTLTQTDVPINVQEEFIEQLCIVTGDREIKNRVDKVRRQHDQVEQGKNVYGIKELSKFLNVNLPSFDALKRTAEYEIKEYPLIDGHAYSLIQYPPVKFVLEPLFTERSTSQIFGAKESGKTLVGQACSIAIPSGNDFLDYKCVKPMPTGYVEGELPGEELRSRRDTILNDYWHGKIKKNYNAKWTFTLCRDDLEMAGFKYGFDPIAVARNLSNTDAQDYGRKGRKLIENWLRGIEKKTGHKPFLFLDNIQALADIDENRASDWTPLLQWTNHLKHKGYPNCFMHHANKSTGTSSGSSAKERMLDTSISFTKLNPEERLDMPGLKNLQTRVKFDKARNFGGGKWDLPFILTMDENGKFTKYPNLTKDDFKIIKLHKEGNTVKEMTASKELNIAEKTIYKKLKRLKDMEVIKDDKPSK